MDYPAGVKMKIPAVCHVSIGYDHVNLSTVSPGKTITRQALRSIRERVISIFKPS